jgi:hypothetical protein
MANITSKITSINDAWAKNGSESCFLIMSISKLWQAMLAGTTATVITSQPLKRANHGRITQQQINHKHCEYQRREQIKIEFLIKHVVHFDELINKPDLGKSP